MSGLETAASIAGLAALADLVITKGYKYYSLVKEAKTEIRSLLDETALLHGALNNLRFSILRLGDYAIEQQLGSVGAFGPEASEILRNIFMTSECLMACKNVLHRLSEVIPDLDDNASSSKRARISCRWPFKKDETEQITQSIQRYKSNIMIALQTTTISALISALKGQDAVKDIAEQIRIDQIDIMNRLERIELDTKKKRILKWASTMSPRASYQNNLKLRYTGTAKWFSDRDEYKKWKSTRSSRLWLSGIPGAGKSVIVSSIIERLIREMEDDDAIAFHYCDYKSKDSQKLENIFCSLIMQASVQSTSAFGVLKELYNKYNPDKSLDSHLCDSGADFPRILSQISKDYTNLIIVVDGLDECAKRDELAQKLIQLPDTGLHRIKVLVSSRPEPDLEIILSIYDTIEVAASKSDVQLYVASVIEDRIRSRKLRLGRHRPEKPDLKSLILDGLVEGCKGMFQWVVCQIDYLCQLGSDKERRNALKDLPPGLNGIYQKILERVTSTKSASENNKEYLLRAIRWLTFSMDPLTLSQAAEAASNVISKEGLYDEDSILDKEKILELGSSLFRVNRETKCLEFSHFTVKDFFLQLGSWSERPSSLDFFKLNRLDSHKWLAKFCLRYMMLKDFKSAYRLNDTQLLELYSTYPLLKYADYYWDEHARAALPYWDDDLHTLVKDFLRVQNNCYFLRWRRCNALPSIGDSRPDFYMSTFFKNDSIHLFVATGFGLLGAVKGLLEQGVNVNAFIPGCGTPLATALEKFYEPVGDPPVGDPSENQPWSLSQDYNEIISLLIDNNADPNISDPEYDHTDPFFAFFQSPKYSSTVAALLFPKLAKQVSMAVTEALCTRLQSQWITNPEAIELLNFSALELWDRDRKSRICEALMRNGASESDVRHLIDTHQPGAPNENEGPHATETFTRKRSHTFDEEIAARCLPDLLSAAKSGMSDTVNDLISKYPRIASMRDSEGLSALDHACMRGHGTVVSRLLGCNQVSVDTRTSEGSSPLHFACVNAHYDCCRLLLDAGAHVNAQDKLGYTPLTSLWVSWLSPLPTLASRDWRQVSRISDAFLDLPSKTVDFNLKSEENVTYFHIASQLPATKYLEFILDQNPKIDLEIQDQKNGQTALHRAAKNKKSSFVKILLSHNATVDAYDINGNTPLILACRYGAPDTVTMLIQAGANIFSANKDGFLPQHFACQSSNPNTLASFSEAVKISGSKFSYTASTRKRLTMLHIATANRSPKTALKLVEYLLKEPEIDANFLSIDQHTAFFAAAEMLRTADDPEKDQLHRHSVDSPCYQRLQVLKTLLPRTTSPNNLSVLGYSPLSRILATRCENCWKECVLTIKLHSQIGIEAKVTAQGLTPLLHSILFKAPVSRVQHLLDCGASATARTSDGYNALHMITHPSPTYDAISLIDFFCARGVDVDAQCTKGRTPLMLAAASGNVVFVRTLLNHKASTTATDSEGKSAIHHAINSSDASSAITKILIDSGASIENYPTVDGHEELPPLLQATRIGNLNVLNLLLDQESINIFAIWTETGEGIWHIAVRSSSPPKVIDLLRNKKVQSPINLVNTLQQTPLHLALYFNLSESVIQALIEAGSDIHAEDHNGVSCLQYAIHAKSTTNVSLLLTHLPRFDCATGQNFKFNRLSQTFCYDAQILNLVLEHHENISYDEVLLFARIRLTGPARETTYDLIASFIRQEKVYNGTCFVSDDAGRDAFTSAEEHSNLQFSRALEEWKPTELTDNLPSELNPEVSDEACFHWVLDKIELDKFESIPPGFFSTNGFERIKNINYETVLERTDLYASCTVLQIAIYYENLAAVETFLRNGCLLRTRNLGGWEALFYILKEDEPSMLDFVADVLESLESKKDHRLDLRAIRCLPGSEKSVNETALHYLARCGHWRCVRTLVEKASLFFKVPEGVEIFSVVDLLDSNGETPMRLAIEYGNSKFVEEMLKLPQKPDVSAWGPHGACPLVTRALELENPEIAEILVTHYPESRCDRFDQFRPEHKSFFTATDTQYLEILLRTGADLNFWDSAQGHAIHCLLQWNEAQALGIVLDHMGPEWATNMLTKRASMLGNGFEIVGRNGRDSCFEVLQDYFGPLLPAIRVEYLEEGATAAINQGYLELAEKLNSIVEQRKRNKIETCDMVIGVDRIHKICLRKQFPINFL